jgi:hypothetical protein
VQYFERVRLEYHPENSPPYDVLLGQFGRAVAPERYALYERDAAPAPPLPGQDYFPETSHNLGGAFRDYWRANGGLPQFGYPLTEEFQGDYGPLGFFRVQCFERACFELHPENAPPYDVLLTQLGRLVLAQVDLLSGPLGRLYTTNAEVRRVIGPPQGAQASVAGATQAFAGGRMIYFAPAGIGSPGTIRAFCGLRAGRLYFATDTWAEGQDPGGGPAPEPGRYLPRRGFGKLWRENGAIRDCLGYALTPEERGGTFPFQRFARGELLAIPDERAIYAVACSVRSSPCTFTVYDNPTP